MKTVPVGKAADNSVLRSVPNKEHNGVSAAQPVNNSRDRVQKPVHKELQPNVLVLKPVRRSSSDAHVLRLLDRADARRLKLSPQPFKNVPRKDLPSSRYSGLNRLHRSGGRDSPQGRKAQIVPHHRDRAQPQLSSDG